MMKIRSMTAGLLSAVLIAVFSTTAVFAQGVSSRISIDQIEALGTVDVNVDNPYEDGAMDYSGVMMDVFVEGFGGEDVQKIIGTAIDDYRIEWTREEWETLPIMFVTRVEGERISFEQRGPMRIVYTEYDPTQKVYQDLIAKWMWMIVTIEFE